MELITDLGLQGIAAALTSLLYFKQKYGMISCFERPVIPVHMVDLICLSICVWWCGHWTMRWWLLTHYVFL